MKKVCIIICVIVAVMVPGCVFGSSVGVTVNQEWITFNSSSGYPYEQNGRTYVPIRNVLEACGLKLSYHDDNAIFIEDNATGLTVMIAAGSPKYIIYQYSQGDIPGAIVRMDASPVIKNGRTYMPIRPILEAFGMGVGWDQQSKTVLINTDGTIPVVLNNTSQNPKTGSIISNLSTQKIIKLNEIVTDVYNSSGDKIELSNTEQLIDFAIDYIGSQGYPVSRYDSFNSKILTSQIDKVINDFFGLSNVAHTDTTYGNYMGDYYICPVYEGSETDICQVNSILDNGDGTYTLKVAVLTPSMDGVRPANLYLPKDQWAPIEQSSFELLSTINIKVRVNSSSPIGFNLLSYDVKYPNLLNSPNYDADEESGSKPTNVAKPNMKTETNVTNLLNPPAEERLGYTLESKNLFLESMIYNDSDPEYDGNPTMFLKIRNLTSEEAREVISLSVINEETHRNHEFLYTIKFAPNESVSYKLKLDSGYNPQGYTLLLEVRW